MKLPYMILFLLVLQGCGTVDKAVKEYYDVQDEIRIGDTKEKVLSLLEPGQEKLSARNKKPPTRYTKDGHVYDIYYARTGRIPDSETTDDELTPHIFEDGILIAIGWDYLGGPERTSAEVARERAQIEKARASATKIEVKQEVNQDSD